MTNGHERGYVQPMARRQDQRQAENALTEQFGGDWTCWSAENSGVPGVELCAQYRQTDSGRWVVSGLLLRGDALTADQLRRVPMAALENSQNLSDSDAIDRVRADLQGVPELRRADGMGPEDFSRLVAEHYTVWARYVRHPADAIAAEYGVKPPTVHTWIREARLRGFLPPAQRGKAKPAAPKGRGRAK